MKKILLPTDFSGNSKNAIAYALHLYKNSTCTFFLVNTYTPVIYNYGYRMSTRSYLTRINDAVKENSLEKLQETKDEFIKKFNNDKHHFKTISSFNLLTDEIMELVKQYAIDLIIMGTKGATGAKEILFGTNTIHIIQKTKCPVLAIPENYSFKEPSQILFPTDYKIAYTHQHIQNLITLATNYQSEIHILHVSQNIELSNTQKTNKTTLQKLLKINNHTFHTVKDQPIPKAINNFQEDTDINLLMMLNNKHSFLENLFFKSVINQIGFHLHVPFLVIPAKV